MIIGNIIIDVTSQSLFLLVFLTTLNSCCNSLSSFTFTPETFQTIYADPFFCHKHVTSDTSDESKRQTIHTLVVLTEGGDDESVNGFLLQGYHKASGR